MVSTLCPRATPTTHTTPTPSAPAAASPWARSCPHISHCGTCGRQLAYEQKAHRHGAAPATESSRAAGTTASAASSGAAARLG
eukprot:scaffold924_cov99-Isochrysis_galbana.AAC.4